MSKKKIAFLFGAGTELSFGLPKGYELKNKTMETESGFGKKKLGKALKKYFTFDNGYKHTADTLGSRHVKTKNGDSYLSGVLDGYFHSIIDPMDNEFKKKFPVVFNFYWILYFEIVNAIMKFLDKNDLISESLKHYFDEDDNELNYEKILQKIGDFTNQLYSIEINPNALSKENYFSFIDKKLKADDSFSCTGIITTNYYKFSEIIENTKYAYPNGKLNWFEFPLHLEVRDLLKNNDFERDLFFPFVFGQSYVKPIVHRKQIEEFERVSEILGISSKGIVKPDCLVVLGYNINKDDNHLNALIHEYLVNGGKMLFVTNEDINTRKEKLIDELKIKSNTECLRLLNVDYNNEESIVNRIFKEVEEILK